MLAGCSTPGRNVPFDRTEPLAATSGQLVTLLDYLESGRRAVDHFLSSLPEAEARELRSAIDRSTRASVRVAVIVRTKGLSYEQASASGALVATANGRPRVLTAGHSFTAGDFTTRVTTLTGARLAVTPPVMGVDIVVDERGDWAVLELAGADASRALATVAIAPPVKGELAFALAYPDQCGVDSTGRIVRGEAYEDDALAPLVTILRVESEAPLVLAPVAGALPLGGASGGGIFDRRGALIANLTGTGWESDRNGVTYSIDACAVSVMQHALD